MTSLATCLVVYNRNDCWGRYEFGAFCRGLKDEHEEHPHLSLDEAAALVMDHLDRSPSYYPDDQAGWTAASHRENPDDMRPSRRWGRLEGREWTQEERNILRDMSEYRSAKEVAKALGRSEESVRKKAWKLGVNFGGSRFISAAEVARNIGVSKTSVGTWAKKLGLLRERGTAKGRSTPLELEDVIEILDALLDGTIGFRKKGGGGVTAGATTKAVREYRDRLMGVEPGLRENPPTDFSVTRYRGGVRDLPYLIVSVCAHDMVLAWAKALENELIDPGYLDELESDFMDVWTEFGVHMADREMACEEELGYTPSFDTRVRDMIMNQVDQDGRNRHLSDPAYPFLAERMSGALSFTLLLKGCYGQTYLWLEEEVVDLDKLKSRMMAITFQSYMQSVAEQSYSAARQLSRVMDDIARRMEGR